MGLSIDPWDGLKSRASRRFLANSPAFFRSPNKLPLALILLPCAFGHLVPTVWGLAQTDATDAEVIPQGPATADEIAVLIDQLSDPSYSRRTFATHRLVAIGMSVRDQLQSVMNGADQEKSLRATRVLALLDNLLFGGTEIALEFSKSSIAWDEAVDLTVTVTNRSDFPSRIPFEIPADVGAQQDGDARQVARMLDVSDWLRLEGPHGQRVELRVDDIAGHDDVTNVVQRRLSDAPWYTVPPGRQVRVTVPEFNRGWARYPLLEEGRYTVTFEYVPAWEDDALARSAVGRVASRPAFITVTRAAPADVSRTGVEVAVELTREGPSLVARLVNRSDLPIVANLNVGPAAPFAEVQWVLEDRSAVVEFPVAPLAPKSWADFDAEGLKLLPAGKSVELVRTSLLEFRKAAEPRWRGFDRFDGIVYVSYSNFCDRRWQLQQENALRSDAKAPDVLRQPFSRRLIAVHQASNRLRAFELR